MTVGLLGGTFDPPHNGHVALARRRSTRSGSSGSSWSSVGEAPHKPVETDAETRFRLAEAAFADLPGVELSRVELDRGGPSYTVDTARWAARALRRRPLRRRRGRVRRLPRLAGPGRDPRRTRASPSRPGREPTARRDRRGRSAGLARPDRIVEFELDPLPIASRDVRDRVARGEPIDGLVPLAVAQLIDELGLYRATL